MGMLFDMNITSSHNDLPWNFHHWFKNRINKVNLTGPLMQHTDIPRLRKGLVGGQFWSIYVPCKKNDLEYADQVRMALDQIDVTRRFVENVQGHLQLATSPLHVRMIHKGGKIASMMGMEGGHMIDMSLAVLRMYFDLGVRYLTLTHGCNTQWADSATDVVRNGGLSPFGYRVVEEMNRLGMLVDLAHVSHDVMRVVIMSAKAPVIFSHSSAYSICKHPRNVPDDVLRLLKHRDGVVMVNFYSGYVKCTNDGQALHATLSDVADHIEHIAAVAGWEHVGIGGDYDGVDEMPDGLEDVSKYPDLFVELARRGATRESLKLLAGENLLRVWEKVESYSERIRMKPVEDVLELEKVCEGQIKFIVQG